ncbi:hypothetical protein NQ317_002294 [Molorchus minor]|uniref:Uncharacterized protein n=1 Tax=Molorchus minor TaxID=1323400 RepID=A0ABQ9J519_9CUCU|nr:hypothetical protein NQ317_002294 [Molorchus minor]
MESFNLNNNGFVKTPCTPSSINSSGLPSIAETESTNLDSELNTPFVDQVIHQPEPVLDHTELQQFAFQIANGMAWLEKIPITHRQKKNKYHNEKFDVLY